MEERYVIALHEGDPYYLQQIEQELLLALAQESIDVWLPSEGSQELPF
jgi:hypothetical protein